MNYNWDDIEVDDTLTHNSRYFFANYKCAAGMTNANAGFNGEQNMLEFEAIEPENQLKTLETENKKNEPESNIQLVPTSSRYNLRSSIILEMKTESQSSSGILIKNEVVAEDNQNNTQLEANSEDVKLAITDEVDEISTAMNNVEILREIKLENNENQIAMSHDVANTQTVKLNNLKSNIMTPSKWGNGAVSKGASKSSNGAIPKPPRAYHFQNLYQNKREELLRKQREEERKMREFNSRPAPNFQPKVKKTIRHYITAPVTPIVLKRSKENERKRLEKLEELKRQYQPSPFKAQENIIVKDKPFVPIKEPLILEQRPFNLRCERRLQERKEFDQAIQRALEEKQKQKEEMLKQEEERQIKEIRKETNFKARPNPFNKK